MVRELFLQKISFRIDYRFFTEAFSFENKNVFIAYQRLASIKLFRYRIKLKLSLID